MRDREKEVIQPFGYLCDCGRIVSVMQAALETLRTSNFEHHQNPILHHRDVGVLRHSSNPA